MSNRELKYSHAEAFCLMKYRSDDGSQVEILWNSRDGVTPFCILSRDGTKELTHVDWQRDVRDESHQPLIGERIFATMTPDMAHAAAVRRVEQVWNREKYPASERFESKEQAVELFANEMIGGVTVVEITAENIVGYTPVVHSLASMFGVSEGPVGDLESRVAALEAYVVELKKKASVQESADRMGLILSGKRQGLTP